MGRIVKQPSKPRVRCRICKRTVVGKTPRGGDGSAMVPIRHLGTNQQICAGIFDLADELIKPAEPKSKPAQKEKAEAENAEAPAPSARAVAELVRMLEALQRAAVGALRTGRMHARKVLSSGHTVTFDLKEAPTKRAPRRRG